MFTLVIMLVARENPGYKTALEAVPTPAIYGLEQRGGFIGLGGM